MRYVHQSRQRGRHHHPEGGFGPLPHEPHEHGPHDHGPHDHGPHDGGPRDHEHEGPHGPHGPHGHGGWHGRRGRGRAARGDVRAAVLVLLAEQPRHGYQLMQAIAERTGGLWRPSPGAIYPTIAQLEDEGLVTTVAESGRKLVTLTDAGRAWLADSAATVGDPFGAFADAPGRGKDLRGAVEDVALATRSVARTGDEAQVAAAHAILTEARRSLYLLLADGAPAAESLGEGQ